MQLNGENNDTATATATANSGTEASRNINILTIFLSHGDHFGYNHGSLSRSWKPSFLVDFCSLGRSTLAMMFAVISREDLSGTTAHNWSRGHARGGDCTGESPGLPPKVRGGDDALPSVFFFTAF